MKKQIKKKKGKEREEINMKAAHEKNQTVWWMRA
jgi:hypothetical protein